MTSHMSRWFRSKISGSYARTLFWGVAAFIAGTVLIYAAGILWTKKDNSPPAKTPPYYHEIMEIIRPLNYSGFYAIQKPGVSLSVDFKDLTWTLHGIRRYAPDGTLLLDEGRNGLCAELVYDTFQKLKPVLGKEWQVKFVRAVEPGFFSAPESNHVILILGSPATGAAYLLDPSFHHYGRASDFPQYAILGAKNELPSFEKKDPDITLAVNGSFPLLIRGDFLVLLSVESVSGFTDPKNLMLAVSSRRRYETSDHYLMILRKQDGKTQWFENGEAVKKLFSPAETEEIRKKFAAWMETL